MISINYEIKVSNCQSFIPVHVIPSPLYPPLQVHVNEPTVLAHVASASQLWAPSAPGANPHSSTSKKDFKLYVMYMKVRFTFIINHDNLLIFNTIDAITVVGICCTLVDVCKYYMNQQHNLMHQQYNRLFQKSLKLLNASFIKLYKLNCYNAKTIRQNHINLNLAKHIEHQRIALAMLQLQYIIILRRYLTRRELNWVIYDKYHL